MAILDLLKISKQKINYKHQTLDKLRQRRLFGMYEAFKTNLEGSIKETLTPDQFLALLDIIEGRHGKRSTLIASQILVKEWYDIIG